MDKLLLVICFSRHGSTASFAQERFYALGGVPSRDILKLLSAEQGLALDPLAVAREKEAEYLPLGASRADHHRGGDGPEALWAHSAAVASSGGRMIIEPVLAHLGLRHLFQAVVTSEDVARQKPAPDIFLEAARRLGVPPHSCRAYEDTDLGMQAIRTAAMGAVDVRRLLPVQRGR